MSFKRWMLLMGAIVTAAWVMSFAVLANEALCEDWPCGNECENDSGCLDTCYCDKGICS